MTIPSPFLTSRDRKEEDYSQIACLYPSVQSLVNSSFYSFLAVNERLRVSFLRKWLKLEVWKSFHPSRSLISPPTRVMKARPRPGELSAFTSTPLQVLEIIVTQVLLYSQRCSVSGSLDNRTMVHSFWGKGISLIPQRYPRSLLLI